MAADAEIKLFAALPGIESLFIGPGHARPFVGGDTMKVTDSGLVPLLQARQLRRLRFAARR